MSSVTVALVLLVVQFCVVLTEHIFRVPGEQEIVCLFDIHAKFQDGRCGDFNEQTMEMAYTTLWKMEQLNVTNPSSVSIGLSVYDVCGSDKRAIEILSQYVRAGTSEGNDTRLAGVISYTGTKTGSAISTMLHHLHIPHIQFTDDVIADEQETFDNRKILSLTPLARIEAAVDALGLLNWTYVSVQTLPTAPARAEQEYFTRRLKEVGICQEKLQTASENNGTLTIHKAVPKAVVAFTGDQLTKQQLLNVRMDPTNKLLLVGDIGNVSGSNFGDNIMVLLEQYTHIDGLAEYISEKQNLNEQPGRLLPRFNCSEGENECSLPTMSSQRHHVTGNAVRTLYKVIETLAVMECTTDNDSCSPASLGEQIEYHSNGGQAENWKPYVQLVPLSESYQEETDSTFSNLHGSVKVQGRLSEDVFGSKCEENCLVCSMCDAKYSSSERIIIRDADIFIVGSFPIYKSSIGNRCGSANPRGLQAARSFLSAIDSFKTRYNDTIALQNITIGGVVFDSCPFTDSLKSRISDVESCIYNYKDASGHMVSLPPTRTTGYFNYFDDINNMATTSGPKITGTVSPLGFGLDEQLNYIKSLIKVLQKVKWTYFRIIYSANKNLKSMVNEFHERIVGESLCVAEVIEIGPSVDDYLPQDTLMNTKDVGTILFTTLDDTVKILDSFQSFNSSSSKQKFFMFPWNVEALIAIKYPTFLENALVIRPRTWLETPGINDTLSDDVIPWIEEFQTTSNETDKSNADKTVVVGVDILMSTINAVYRELCPKQNGVCSEFSDFKALKPRLEETFSMLISGMESPFEVYDVRTVNGKLDSVQIGEVDVEGNVKLELSNVDNAKRGYLDIPSSVCQTWCPECYVCSHGRQSGEDLLYLPGEIIITGVLPIHQSGLSPFTCGDVADDIFSQQLAEAFMYAVETAQRRYPYLLGRVSVGGMIIDSCSNPHKSTQMIGNFETCDFKFPNSDLLIPSPKSNLAYIIHGENSSMDSAVKSAQDLGKLAVATYNSIENPQQISGDSSVQQKNMAIVDLLVKLNWTYIYLVTSEDSSYRDPLEEFLKTASNRGICVGKILGLGATVESIVEVAKYLTEDNTAVVMMTKRSDIKLFFNSQSTDVPIRPWIIDISGDDWNSENVLDVKVPQGSLLIDKNGKQNVAFEKFMSDVDVSSLRNSDWWRQYWQIKFNCSVSCDFNLQKISWRPFSVKAARMIRSVDIALHTIHQQYLASCPLTNGICSNFVKSGMSLIPSRALEVYFREGEERMEFNENGQISQKYQIKTYSSDQQYEVGVWRDGVLTLQTSFFQYLSSSTCTVDCNCENRVKFTNVTKVAEQQSSPDRFVYWRNSGIFTGKLWATVLVAIAATGAFISVVLIVYVVHKVCNKTLARRYVGLGILLLVGVMLLFLSIVPFVFTPSETLCGLRFVMPGCAFAFCFATILVKLTSLRDYRLIGLGGEVSNLNQYLFVVFVTVVQVGIAIQWWVLKTPLVLTKTMDNVVFYACHYGQLEYILHQVYIMVLILLCATYAITVRHETKNMGEARLLLWCCWLCVPVWIAWIIVFLIQDPEYSDPTVCVAIVSCATLMMTVIFIPKIHMVAKIKYSISKGATSFQNGYKLDSEFFYEKPYSLPGTLTTNYSTMKTGYSTTKTHPRSISNFDATLSY
ncbi:hypothetical protein LOTGIDRAFT_169148 [Lottia gigantea]|uniref:G-protein coupled receptors family 3 profile domain-containing protein n=1 Tax=Lottia gigantea TaxID=225164 RepID=V4B5C7_LOTGI|nr:hypothetical protein LOTGIDRAFT_169148 [Lottia gigantea]ESO83669.1 hypothetical protein LOTGIDRAFT_169148 [Lottia gigantea]